MFLLVNWNLEQIWANQVRMYLTFLFRWGSAGLGTTRSELVAPFTSAIFTQVQLDFTQTLYHRAGRWKTVSDCLPPHVHLCRVMSERFRVPSVCLTSYLRRGGQRYIWSLNMNWSFMQIILVYYCIDHIVNKWCRAQQTVTDILADCPSLQTQNHWYNTGPVFHAQNFPVKFYSS